MSHRVPVVSRQGELCLSPKKRAEAELGCLMLVSTKVFLGQRAVAQSHTRRHLSAPDAISLYAYPIHLKHMGMGHNIVWVSTHMNMSQKFV